MTNCEFAGIIGSCLSFAGGAILSWDALTVVRGTKGTRGADQFFALKNQMGVRVVVYDKDGKPYTEASDVQLGIAQRKFELTLFGFGLMALGFLVDLMTKLYCAS